MFLGDGDVLGGSAAHPRLQGVDLGGDLFATNEEGVGVGVLRGEGGEIRAIVLYDGIVAVGFEQFFGDGIEPGRDQYFSSQQQPTHQDKCSDG